MLIEGTNCSVLRDKLLVTKTSLEEAVNMAKIMEDARVRAKTFEPVSEVEFLGHRINKEGIWPTFDKIETSLALEKIFGLFGIPMSIQCDNGTHFQGQIIKLCKNHGIRILRSALRYPQANGQVERFNREIRNQVRMAIALNQN